MRSEQGGLAGKHHRIYKIWHAMLTRCYDPACENFPLYGGRGISVCADWVSFTVFCHWALSLGETKGMTIDRIDVNGNYEPGNCRFATPKQQARNKTDTVRYECFGESLCLPEWAERTGISQSTLIARVKQMGWPLEKALTTSPRSYRQQAC